MIRRIFCLALLSITAAMTTIKAQSPPMVHSRMIPDTIMIGDQLRMEIDIDHDMAQELQLPMFDKNQLTKEIEVIDGPRVDTLEQDGRRLLIRLTYTLTSFDAGIHAVTGFPVVYTDKNITDTVKSTDLMALVVNTFEIDTTKQTIYDIKVPLGAPLQFAEIRDYVIYGAIIAAILAVIIYFIARTIARRRGKVHAKPAEPPHITAIRELERLHSEKLWQNGRHKEYYSRLTDIIRMYLEGRYEIYAMEMTSPEIMAAISEVNSDKLKEKMREMFYLADLVKFAKWTPTSQENEQAYIDAYYYVEETKLLAAEPVNTNLSENA